MVMSQETTETKSPEEIYKEKVSSRISIYTEDLEVLVDDLLTLKHKTEEYNNYIPPHEIRKTKSSFLDDLYCVEANCFSKLNNVFASVVDIVDKDRTELIPSVVDKAKQLDKQIAKIFNDKLK